MPLNDDDLSILYTESEVEKTTRISNKVPDKEDDIGQTALSEYMVHQFKNFVGGTKAVDVELLTETDLSPQLSPVYLQIYNHINNIWETIDSNNTYKEEITFELKGRIKDTRQYINSHGIISVRVWQLAI